MLVTILLRTDGIEVSCPQTRPASPVLAELFREVVTPRFDLTERQAGEVIHLVGWMTLPPDLRSYYLSLLIRRLREVGFDTQIEVDTEPEPRLRPCGSMLPVLGRALAALRALLDDEAGWHSLDVDYELPRVERLYRPFEDDYRLYLHDIHPCDGGQALFRTHPWGSAMHAFDEYEMDVGVGAGLTPPPVVMRVLLAPGTQYEMTHPDAWHSARPRRHHARSVMVTGRPWGRESPRPHRKLVPLSEERRRDLLALFRTLVTEHMDV